MATTTASAAPPLNTVPYDQCTLATCPVSIAQIPYAPNLAGNVLFLAIHGACLVTNLAFGLWFRTWGLLIAMTLGCLLQILGYVGRIKMHYNPFPEDPFLLYLICVTIASIFFTAAVYLCLSRIVVVYGEHLSILKPRTYTVLFILCDFISLLLQAGGGTIVSMADNYDFSMIGLHIMQAGLSFQVASLVIFIGLSVAFFWTCRRRKEELDLGFEPLRKSIRFRVFLWTLSIATLAMLGRCTYRVAELSGGFHGHIWYNEIDYMIFEGALIALCDVLLTVGHPGIGFKGYYLSSNFKIKTEPSRQK